MVVYTSELQVCNVIKKLIDQVLLNGMYVFEFYLGKSFL